MIFWNDLLYPYREGIRFEDFDSYNDIKTYMKVRSREFAGNLNEKDERNNYSLTSSLNKESGR